MTSTESTPAVPIPSATIIVLRQRDEMEVLLVERAAAGPFGSAHVFPGGKLDADDCEHHWLPLIEGADGLDDFERGLRIAGWRELFEETGLLPEECAAAARDEPFRDVVLRSGIRLPLHHMHPFARWITPARQKRRWDTYFFLCALDTHDAVCDGLETVSLDWATPARALAESAAGERLLLFPTRAQLHLLMQSATIEEAVRAANARPLIAIEPTYMERDGATIVTIPKEAGYPITEERGRLQSERSPQ